MEVRNLRREIGIGISILTTKPSPNATRTADQYPSGTHRMTGSLMKTIAQKEIIGHAGTWLMVPATRQDLDAHWSGAGNAHLCLNQNAVVPWISPDRMTAGTVFAGDGTGGGGLPEIAVSRSGPTSDISRGKKAWTCQALCMAAISI